MKPSKREVKMIRDALDREGIPDGEGHIIVPEDFFTRLNADLNRRQGPSIIEQILQKYEGEQ